MPITAVFDGYVAKNPIFSQNEYGKYAEITLRVSVVGREVHYATCRFYGKKISAIRDWVNNGDYMTMSGSVNSIQHRQLESGVKYCQLYIKDGFFTIPPKVGASPTLSPTPPPSAFTLDESEDPGDNEVQF